MWVSSKEILLTVESVVLHKQSDLYTEFDDLLTKYKLLFLNPLENKEKDTKDREELKKGNKESVNVDGHLLKLKEEFIQDALLISDALNLNESSCAELLLSAEQQSPNFPGLSRNLVASLLYHDGRKSLLAALKLLLVARSGVTWTLELDDRIVELVDVFTNHLLEDGLVSKLVQLLQETSLPGELKKLESAHSLVNGRHKKLVTELIEEQQLLVADCVFTISRQTLLPKDDCIKLSNYLKMVKPNTSDGSLDCVTLRVFLALVSAFNCDIADAAGENDSQYNNLPFVKDKSFISSLHQNIVRPDINLWEMPGLKCAIQFCWALFLRSCSVHSFLSLSMDVFEQDENIIDIAIDGEVFKFLRCCVIQSSKFHKEEYFVKTVHSFVTSFIVKFPLKLKDLRTAGDESSHILIAHVNEGMEPPVGLKHDFKEFMLLVSELYAKDSLNLSSEYWIPSEPLGRVFSPPPLQKMQQVVDQRKLMLSKFVRHAGDVLLQPLYVPYIKMLTSLANNEESAAYCFRLLSSSGSVESRGTCAVSWNHFFFTIKQYYVSLRQITSIDHRSHIHRHQEISPEELIGLESIINLVKVLAAKNENVRIAFCENQTWLPVASLLGLVCCSIPSTLKGLLLETLAEFSRTPEIATSLWQSLEASQVLQTNQASGVPKSGIAVELQEIESRNETYPVTRGFISLLDQLTNIAVPETLGAGHRVPGFQPFLDFLINSVFLKFKTRAYQDSTEKWQVCTHVVKLLVKILRDYEPEIEHFHEKQVHIQGVSFGHASKPPGYELMLLMMNDTPAFRTCLSVIDDVLAQLQCMVANSGMKEVLEESAGFCLQLLELVLDKQALFTDLLRNSGSSQMVVSLPDLLLSVNPRTSSPDYLLILTKYITLDNLFPSVTLSIVRILNCACESTTVQRNIVDLISKDEICLRQILVGFSDQLEISDPEERCNEDTGDVNVRDLIRQEIVHLLICCADHYPPNLTQFLLGFDLQQHICKTNFQEPGVRGFPKTCLHAVVKILDRHINNSHDSTPKLSEMLYNLVYILCANTDMGVPIRRYLRLSVDYFTRHTLSLQKYMPLSDDEILSIRLSNKQTWFLKTLAVELKVMATNCARSSLQKLLEVILCHAEIQTERPFLDSTQMGHDSFRLDREKNLLFSLLSRISFLQRYPPDVALKYFDYGAIEQLLLTCEESDSSGYNSCNVKKLHRIMMREVNNLQVGLNQRLEMIKEVKEVLKHAIDRNLVRDSFHAKLNAFDAWRQVLEVVFAVCPVDVMLKDKHEILLEVLNELFSKLNDSENSVELLSPIAGAILSMMANLWFTFSQLERTLQKKFVNSIMTSLFSSILESVKASSQSRVRVNLYAALLYYVQIGELYNSVVDEDATDGIFDGNSKGKWESHTLKALNVYGDTFLDVVARDTCQGACIIRIMAMSVMDAVATIDWQRKYLSLMTSQGYMTVLVEQLIKDDPELLEVLSFRPNSMKPLYLFQSKMALLAKVASTDVGAQCLLRIGLFSRLSECEFLDWYVDKPLMVTNHTIPREENPFQPDVSERYSNLFDAFAHLVLAFISSLGVKHTAAVEQIRRLIMAHKDVFLNILHDECDSLNSLRRLSSTISILSLLPMAECDDEERWRLFMMRVQRHVTLLMHRFSSFSAIMKIIIKKETDGRPSSFDETSVEIKNTVLQIRAQLLTFVKNMLSRNGLSGPVMTVLFAPCLTRKTESTIHAKSPRHQLPSLSLLIEQLKSSPVELKQSYEERKMLNLKLDSLHEMRHADINEIISHEPDVERLPFNQRISVARRILEKLLKLREKQAEKLMYILEHASYILWRHLEYFYMVGDDMLVTQMKPSKIRNLTSDSMSPISNKPSTFNAMKSLDVEEVEEMKREVPSIFNQRFWNNILECEKLQRGSELTFLSALVRRMQGLLQLNS